MSLDPVDTTEQQMLDKADEDVEAFVASMATAARSLIDVRIPDAETQQKLHARLSSEQAPGLVEIAQACVAMDMTLTELSYQLPPLDPAQD